MAIFNSYISLPEGKFMNTLVLLMNYIPQTYPIESLSHTSPSLWGFPMIVATFYDTHHYVYASYIPVNPRHIPIVVCIFLLFFHYCVVCPLTFMIIVWFFIVVSLLYGCSIVFFPCIVDYILKHIPFLYIPMISQYWYWYMSIRIGIFPLIFHCNIQSQHHHDLPILQYYDINIVTWYETYCNIL